MEKHSFRYSWDNYKEKVFEVSFYQYKLEKIDKS